MNATRTVTKSAVVGAVGALLGMGMLGGVGVGYGFGLAAGLLALAAALAALVLSRPALAMPPTQPIVRRPSRLVAGDPVPELRVNPFFDFLLDTPEAR